MIDHSVQYSAGNYAEESIIINLDQKALHGHLGNYSIDNTLEANILHIDDRDIII